MSQFFNLFQYRMIADLFIVTLSVSCDSDEVNVTEQATNIETDTIQYYTENPYYWQYQVEPLLLLGGCWQDNFFNHPTGLERHLNLLLESGGNYVRIL